jgi:DNA-binding transcriptional MerR regulator
MKLEKLQENDSMSFVNAAVIAKRYKVTPRAVLIWAERGVIPSIRIGAKTRRFNLTSVIAELEGRSK